MPVETSFPTTTEQQPAIDRSRFTHEQQKLLEQIDTYCSHFENPALQTAEVLQILQKRHDELTNQLQKSTQQLSEETQLPQTLKITLSQLTTIRTRIPELTNTLQHWDGKSEDNKPHLKAEELTLLLQDRKNKLQAQIKDHRLSEKEAQPQLLALAGQAIELTTGKKLYDSQYVCAYALINGMPTEFLSDFEMPANSNKSFGVIAEKKSGEGKTLAVGAATIASGIITQISNESVHVMPPNDYLSKRDLQELGKAYELSGLRTGIIIYGGKEQYIFDSTKNSGDKDYPNLIVVPANPLDPSQARRHVYSTADIVYGTIQSFITDELQDNIQGLDTANKRQVRQNPDGTYRPLKKAVALIDEADQGLIDQAKIPVLIAEEQAVTPEHEKMLRMYNTIALQLIAPVYDSNNKLVAGDYDAHGITSDNPIPVITKKGYQHIKQLLEEQLTLPSDPEDPKKDPLDYFLFNKVHPENYDCLRNAILVHAQIYKEGIPEPRYVRFEEGRDFIVTDGKVDLLDEFTKRRLVDTKISLGIHQALETRILCTKGRENEVTISGEQTTLDETSIQAYVRSYRWRSGTTGTAIQAENIFHKIYNLDVVQIPPDYPNEPEILPTILIGNTPEEADTVIADELLQIKLNARNTSGNHQPILILTASITHAQKLGKLLEADGITPTVLTALNPEKEAAIIAQVGRKNTITIATFIAGRGTDPKLGGEKPMPPIQDTGLIYDKNSPEYQDYLNEVQQWETEQEEVINLGGLRIIAADVPDTRRELQQARFRAGRQGQPGSFQIISSFATETLRKVTKGTALFSKYSGEERANRLRFKPTLHKIAYGPQGSSLPYEQPNTKDYIGNDPMITIIQKEAEERETDELELVVHADAVAKRDREHFQRSRDRFRDTYRSELWIREATGILLPRIIRKRLQAVSRDLEKVTGDEQADRQRQERILNDALTLHIPHPSGNDVLRPIATVAEINGFLRNNKKAQLGLLDLPEGEEKEELERQLQIDPQLNLLTLSQQELETAITTYLQRRLTRTQFSEAQLQLFASVAQGVYQHIWYPHLAAIEDIYSGVFAHIKPLTEYSLAAAFDLQERLDFTSERMLVHAVELTRWKTQLATLLDKAKTD